MSIIMDPTVALMTVITKAMVTAEIGTVIIGTTIATKLESRGM
jgi:hypothetical protein